MPLGSPGGRRRRLMQALFVPTSNAEAKNNYYTSVHSEAAGSSIRRRRRTPTTPGSIGDGRKQRQQQSQSSTKDTTGFKPIVDPMADHGYRIRVAKDGSMITAVPIIDPYDDQQQDHPSLRGGSRAVGRPPPHRNRHRPPRALPSSPILFSQPLRSSPNTSVNGSTAVLLDSRVRARHKMKRMRPKTNTNNTATATTKLQQQQQQQQQQQKQSPKRNGSDGNDTFPNKDPFNTAVHTARDKLKQQAKGFLAFTTGGGNGEGRANNHHNVNINSQPRTTEVIRNPKPPPSIKPSRSKDAKEVRWDLSPKRNNQQKQTTLKQKQAAKTKSQQQQLVTKSSNSGTLDDASFGSFPILSPTHKFNDSFFGEEEEKKNEAADDNTNNNSNKEIVGPSANNNSNASPSQPTNDRTSRSYEELLRQRMTEIQTLQKQLAHKNTKNDGIKGTLVMAIDGNLEKNKRHMQELENELKEIEWHLTLDSNKKEILQLQLQHQEEHKKTIIASREDGGKTKKHQVIEGAISDDDIQIARQPSGAYHDDMNESVEIGDPSITADTDSVADLYHRKDNTPAGHGGRVMVMGLDPPARQPSPPTIKEGRVAIHPLYTRRERKEPDGPRISAVLLGGEQPNFGSESSAAGRNNVTRNNNNGRAAPNNRPMRIPFPPIIKSVHHPTRASPVGSIPPPTTTNRPPLNYQHYQPPRQRQHSWQRKRMIPPNRQNQSQVRGKFVHFNLPQASTDSTELKFESTNSTGTPSVDYVGDNLNANGDDLNNNEDISWKEEHFDVDAYNDETGSFISSEHHDRYQWMDKEHHVLVQEHYSRENHHRRQHNPREIIGETTRSPMATNNSNHDNHTETRGGVSSDSVTTDPDLGFINAVAAIVIQTAVRRFLAEMAAAERLYAVHVIQTAVCNWMAKKQNPYFYSNNGEIMYDDHEQVYYDEQNADEMFYEEEQPMYEDQNYDGMINHDDYYDHPRSYQESEPSSQRTKRVIFEDDYNELCEFAATEIQRCYRGLWARDMIEVDHFAASTIQRVFRGWWVRELVGVDRYCATEIQRIVRGYLSRMSYIYDLYCIIVVQSVARRYLAFYTSAVRLANILYIQAIWRGYKVREELNRYVESGREIAACMIQSQWRSYDAQMNYINKLADILIVQSVARRWSALRRMRGKIRRRPVQESTVHATYRSKSLPVQKNAHAVWQQHRLNVVANQSRQSYPNEDELDAFDKDSVGGDEWYSGNKSETSDMLKSWKGRKSK